jgi:hypothetical protein
MKYGLDIVMLAGKLHLGKHQTLDEIHQELSERLANLGASISRREVAYLFDAFDMVLRSASDAAFDKEWKADVEKNKGIIVSIDGIKPDGGNETIYLVRDALTGRLLNAENVTESSVKILKQVLSPVLALNVPVIGTISDAQETEVMALEELWPNVPHQTCQFHALQEASRPIFEEDGKYMEQMRENMMEPARNVRKQIHKQIGQVSKEEAEQLAIIDDYALGVQDALNQKGKLPFDYAGIESSEALDELAASLDELEKKGAQ